MENLHRGRILSDYKDFLHNLRSYRHMRKMSQEILAARLGLSRTTITNYENGITYPQVDTVYNIAEALRIEPWRLVESKQQRRARMTKKKSLGLYDVNEDELEYQLIDVQSLEGTLDNHVVRWVLRHSDKGITEIGFQGNEGFINCCFPDEDPGHVQVARWGHTGVTFKNRGVNTR